MTASASTAGGCSTRGGRARAADFEDVGEVGGERDGEAKVAGLRVVVADRQPLEGAGVRKSRLRWMWTRSWAISRSPSGPAMSSGLVRSQIKTALSSRMVELSKKRPVAVHGHVEVREIAGIAVVNAFRAAGAGQGVAVVVEDGEGVGVLHRPRTPLLQRGGDPDEELRQGARNGRGSDVGFGLHGKPTRQAVSGRSPARRSGRPWSQSDKYTSR